MNADAMASTTAEDDDDVASEDSVTQVLRDKVHAPSSVTVWPLLLPLLVVEAKDRTHDVAYVEEVASTWSSSSLDAVAGVSRRCDAAASVASVDAVEAAASRPIHSSKATMNGSSSVDVVVTAVAAAAAATADVADADADVNVKKRIFANDAVGRVGAIVEGRRLTEGRAVDGARVGLTVGPLVGRNDGRTVGMRDGAIDGTTVGVADGATDGDRVGSLEGDHVGAAVGTIDGTAVGTRVGT